MTATMAMSTVTTINGILMKSVAVDGASQLTASTMTKNAGSNRPKQRCLDLNDVKTGKPAIIVLRSEGELHSRSGTSPLYFLFIRLHYIPQVGYPFLPAPSPTLALT
jgi:hypothetical protein